MHEKRIHPEFEFNRKSIAGCFQLMRLEHEKWKNIQAELHILQLSRQF